MQPRTTARVSLTALLGTPVTDVQGHLRGRLKDIAVATGPDAGKVAVHRGVRRRDGNAGGHAGIAFVGNDGAAERGGQLPLPSTGPG